MARITLLLLTLVATLASAADRLVSIETRPGVKLGYWMMERPGATHTVMLLPGGAGGIGYKNGVPTSSNFLVRSRDLFADARMNVAVVGRPTDREDLDGAFRSSADHIQDLRAVAEKLGKDYGKPVWLVGTSRGTISAAAAAAAIDPSIVAGIVLTSSVTNGQRANPVPGLELQAIRVPVLVMHHRDDACRSCNPRETDLIMAKLGAAPVKRRLIVTGGGGAYGDPCEPMHYHGYIGMEREAVASIVEFIRAPSPGS